VDAEDAESTLASEELVACMKATLVEVKELRNACLSADIPVLLGRDDACCGRSGGGCGCAPKAQLLSRPEDIPRVARLMRSLWQDLLRREGTVSDDDPALAVAGDGDPPCPACGTIAPLAGGACTDCGLQLE
jgi:hypothetical protein